MEEITSQALTLLSFDVEEFSQEKTSLPRDQSGNVPFSVTMDANIQVDRENSILRMSLNIEISSYDVSQGPDSTWNESDLKEEERFKVGHITVGGTFAADMEEIRQEGTTSVVPLEYARDMFSVLYGGARGVIAGRAEGSPLAEISLPLVSNHGVANDMKKRGFLNISRVDKEKEENSS